MNWRSIFPTLAACALLSTASFAQQRHCDMKITLISPAEGQVLQPLAHFDIKVKIENPGPDALVAGDTVYYTTPMMILFDFQPYILDQAVPAGQSAEFLLENVANVNENPSDEVVNFCVRVMDKRDTLNNGDFEDSLELNNVDCNEVTIISDQTGIETIKNDPLFSIYPNPASDKLHIRFPEMQFRPSKISVTDLNGRVWKQIHTPNAEPEQSLDISDLSAGVYFLKCENEQQNVFGKFIKR